MPFLWPMKKSVIFNSKKTFFQIGTCTKINFKRFVLWFFLIQWYSSKYFPLKHLSQTVILYPTNQDQSRLSRKSCFYSSSFYMWTRAPPLLCSPALWFRGGVIHHSETDIISGGSVTSVGVETWCRSKAPSRVWEPLQSSRWGVQGRPRTTAWAGALLPGPYIARRPESRNSISVSMLTQ